jgi:transaldolase
VDALASQLQAEGAKSFVSSWNELMDVIASKSAALQKGELTSAMHRQGSTKRKGDR